VIGAARCCNRSLIGCNVRYISPTAPSTAPRAAPRAPASISARLATTALSPALRQVAELLLVDPEAIAFGTVASVAERAGTSTPSVVRLATALGYSGFGELRDAARAELSVRLNTEAVRVRAEPAGDPVAALLAVEQDNVAATLGGIDAATLDALLDLLDDDRRRVWVLPSTQTAGVALRFADQLMIVRDGVTLLDGSEMRVMSLTRALRRGDVFVSLDVPRHELATVRVQGDAVRRGAVPIVLTGGIPTGLDATGGHVVPFACASVGPFDSLVGLTALTSLLVNGLVARRRPSAGRRIAGLERTWTTTGLFDA
jgi:DNA-binding MurR/RpiR family transcriptional regulator